MDDWKKRLSALKSIIIRFKVERREECSKDLEANVEAFSRRVASCTHIPTGELRDDWAALRELTEALGDCKVSRDIVRKSLALFNLLIDVDHEFAVFLYYCCNVLSVVEQQLVDTSVLDGAVAESLSLVQRICTNVTLPVMDHTVDLIVQFLLVKIKMAADPELLLPCLECLASLSFGNIAVQSAIKSQSSLKEINNKLIHLLTGSSSRVTLVTLHVLASLSLNSSLGEALFSTNNIEQTFGIIFNIFYHHGDDKTALSHAVDLMVVLLACERIRTAFVGYKHLRACVQSTLTLLIHSRGESAGKLCELFQAFLSVPELHQMIVNTFFGPQSSVDKRRNEGGAGQGGGGNNLMVTCLLPLMGGSREGGAQWSGAGHRCTSRALDLLREVMEGAVACGLLHSVLLLLPALLPVLHQQLTGSLPSGRNGGTWDVRHSELETVDMTLAMLITVSEIDTAPDEVVQSVTPSVVERLWSLVQSASASPWWAASLPKGQSEDLILGKRCLEDVKVSVTTKLLHFCILVCGVSDAFSGLLSDLLREGDVMALVARGLLSDDSSTVGRVLRVIQHTERVRTFVSHGLRDSVMAACANHTQAVQEREKLRALQVRERQPASHSLTTSDSHRHDNSTSGGPCGSGSSSSSTKVTQSPLESVRERGVAAPPPPSGKKSDNPPLEVDIEAIEELIRKMKEGVGKLQDARASEIMMVYECKLQNMTTKETHLQELLEAKANALFHADRLNSQYRGKMAQIEAECMKLRKLLQQAEKTNEKSQEQATQLQDMVDQSQKEKAALNKKVAHFSDETNKLRTVVAEYETVKKDLASAKSRLEDTQKAKVRLDHKLLAAVKKTEELEQIGVQHQAEQAHLQRLLHRAEEDKSELTQHIAGQEKQFKELKGGIAVFEQQVAEMEAMHREDLQRREELSSQLTLAHREKAHVLEQKNLLQEDCQRMEVCIEEQKKEIDQLHRDNEILQNKFRHIQSVLGDGLLKTH